MLKAICNYSTPLARDIVRTTLAPHRDLGLSTQDIYKAAIQQFPHATQPVPATNLLIREQRRRDAGLPSEPQHREHPIRSVRYLKKIVLEDMAERGQVEKVRIARGSPDSNGDWLDTISVKGLGKVIRANVASKKEEWRWRLVERKDQTLHDLPTEDKKEEGFGVWR